jgi:predicted nucleic acid-binding protein
LIYLDSSALLKLLHEESESAALEQWMSEREGTPVVSSQLANVEVIRACRRVDPGALAQAREILMSIDLVPLTGGLVDQAAEVGEPSLRSLDAVHLASALSLRSEISAFVAYDQRLSDAARSAGLPTVQPGA